MFQTILFDLFVLFCFIGDSDVQKNLIDGNIALFGEGGDR